MVLGGLNVNESEDAVGNELLQAALDDAIADSRAGTTADRGPRRRPVPADGIRLIDDEEERLPPIRRGTRPAETVAEALASSGASSLVPVWYAVREVLIVVALLWVSVIVLAFAAGVEDLTAPLLAAVVARGVWLLLSSLSAAARR